MCKVPKYGGVRSLCSLTVKSHTTAAVLCDAALISALLFSVVDHTAADWDGLGLNFDALFKHVPDSAHPGQSQEEVVTILREQLTQALGKEATEGAYDCCAVCAVRECVVARLLRYVRQMLR
jgi:hypothetical protein